MDVINQAEKKPIQVVVYDKSGEIREMLLAINKHWAIMGLTPLVRNIVEREYEQLVSEKKIEPIAIKTQQGATQ